ncbi:hypothetical protein HDV02_003801 [Globomyces sp. JEL0801]|nr:hypothetical protein HDV02_003801 [Globomyces sp. JEL0801]
MEPTILDMREEINLIRPLRDIIIEDIDENETFEATPKIGIMKSQSYQMLASSDGSQDRRRSRQHQKRVSDASSSISTSSSLQGIQAIAVHPTGSLNNSSSSLSNVKELTKSRGSMGSIFSFKKKGKDKGGSTGNLLNQKHASLNQSQSFIGTQSMFGTQSMIGSTLGSPTGDFETCSVLTGEASIFKPYGTQNISKVDCKINWKGITSSIKIQLTSTVNEVIQDIITQLQIVPESDRATDEQFENSLLLGRKDRNVSGITHWFYFENSIGNYDIQSGDEFKLKNIDSFHDIIVCCPPSNQTYLVKYDIECIVDDTIKVLKKRLQMDDKVFGLYHPKLGTWLDSIRSLTEYDFEKDDVIEFRELVDEMVVRILLVEFNQKIAIKVLPTFKVSDMLSIVQFQVSNRKLSFSRKDTNVWLNPNQMINSYHINQSLPLEYRIEKELLKLMIHTETIELLVDSTITVSQLTDLLPIMMLKPSKEYILVNCMDELYKPTDNLWTILKEISVNDKLIYKPKMISSMIKSSTNMDYIWKLDLDEELTLNDYKPLICRKFGYQLERMDSITHTNSNQQLDLSLSISDLNLTANDQLVVQWKATDEIPSKLNSNINSIFGNLKSGTLDDLIINLTAVSSENSVEYHDYIKTFLLTYQSFTDTSTVIQLLVQSYTVLNLENQNWTEFEKLRKPIQLRICNILLQWIKKYPSGFLNPIDGVRNCNELLEFSDRIISKDHFSTAKQIRKNITRLRDGGLISAPKIRLSYSIPQESKVNLMSIPSEEVAQQLTFIEWTLFSDLASTELLNQSWSKKDGATRAPGIFALTRRFNTNARWVTQSILEHKTVKGRADRISKLIDIASHLMAMNNYSTLMSIIAGINKACIMRLSKTLAEVSPKTIKKRQEMETLMAASGSYKNYRASIKSIAPPCIPFIGTYLTDLTYIEDGNPDFVDHLINFSKREMISKIIRNIMEFQQCCYTIKPNPDILSVLYNLPEASEVNEKAMYLLSKSYE